MSRSQFSNLIFGKVATWTFRISAAASVVLFAGFVYPGLDFSVAPGDIDIGFPTFALPFVIAFVLCFLTAAFIVASRIAIVALELFGNRSNGT